MRDYAKQPQPVSRTIESNPKATNQASITEILQQYKKTVVQPVGLEDENELLQGRFSKNSIQQSSIKKEEPMPPKFENNTGLPDNLKVGIENISGYSMDDVKVHYNSGKPAQLNALAYAQGTEIHVASGQEKHLPHEAWHVVQQKQGRVQPTMQLQGVNVNDNEGLEKEADVMGSNAVQIIDNQTEKTLSIASSQSFLEPIQFTPIKRKITGVTHLVELINGSLYNENYKYNERYQVSHGMFVEIDRDIRYRSRRGPNQEIFSQIDKAGPQHYLWFLVKSINGRPAPSNYYIREDTITHPKQEEKVQAALEKTIYGTDGSENDEIERAYLNGYRDFDCAYSYHNGESYLFFQKFKIHEEEPVRIIYKFKFENIKEASIELSKLFRTPGVIIYTIMLHEVPEQSQNIDLALRYLASLGKTYQCRIGVSNVSLNELDPANIDTIRQSLRGYEVDVSVIENRMNPSIPDKAVYDYCQTNDIQYIAYGLTGPSQAGGTCGMNTDVGNLDYMILRDPALIELAKIKGISNEKLRYLIYSWARSKQNISIIARSSQSERQSENKTEMNDKDIFNALDNLNTTDPETGLSYPFREYLKLIKVPIKNILKLTNKIPAKWLNLYYRKAMGNLQDDDLTEILQKSDLLDEIKTQNPEDLSFLRIYFNLFLKHAKNPVTFPENPTNDELILFINSNQSIEIYSEEGIPIPKEELSSMTKETKIVLYKKGTGKHYRKTITGWEGVTN